MSTDEDFLVADAIVSVRRGMAGLCVGVLAVIGGLTVASDLLTDSPDGTPQSDAPPAAPVTSKAAPATVQDVVRAAKRTKEKAEPKRKHPARRSPQAESPQQPAARNSPPNTRPAPRPAPKPAPDWQELSRSYSGNYGKDWSGNYGQDYWGG